MWSGRLRTISHVPSVNRIVISAAGGGKTTRVVDQALAWEQGPGTTALITYTRNNVREIQLKAYERVRTIPSHVEVLSGSVAQIG